MDPQPPSKSTESHDFERQIHGLVTDPGFLGLQQQRFRPNLFETVAASHRELWHSAFLMWLLDPQSYHGLGDFPLKRFLFAVCTDGILPEAVERPDLSLGIIETLDLSGCVFEKELSIDEGRIDLIGTCEDKGLRIVIENKVESKEGHDQTQRYWQYMKKTGDGWDYDLPVFLTSDEAQRPVCTQFIVTTYQELCDTVLKPCLSHPALPVESRYLLEQYLTNLAKPMKNGIVMARPNQELCEQIYRKHKDVLDEILLAIKQETPAGQDSKARIDFGTPLSRLFEAGLVSEGEALFCWYHKVRYEALLARREDGTVLILYNGEEYKTPSAAGKAITQGPTAGWDFWRVQTKEGPLTLSELRRRLLSPPGGGTVP